MSWEISGNSDPFKKTNAQSLEFTVQIPPIVTYQASKYPPAEPGALVCEPLKAAMRGR
ncbi:MAG: hypothetical protein WB660_11900 [Candidatus Sulfotelmatobacter sp.]